MKELKVELAKLFHERYEYHANKNNWNTQDKCKVEWDDLPEENKKTMIDTIEDVILVTGFEKIDLSKFLEDLK